MVPIAVEQKVGCYLFMILDDLFFNYFETKLTFRVLITYFLSNILLILRVYVSL